MIFLYNSLIGSYFLAIRISSLWNRKAKEWVKGRRNLFIELENKISSKDKIIWIHCSSAGELEQGKPVIESFKKFYPQYKILISFFSYSGYEMGLKYRYADIITYLPEDTEKNAQRFLELVHPSLVVFVKYEFWYHHLSAIKQNGTTSLLISAIFRKDQIFFKPYGNFYRQILFLFNRIFVQDRQSYNLLNKHKINNITISGDTRFDRVVSIASSDSELPAIAAFAGNKNVLIAGSTWNSDELLLLEYIKDQDLKLVIAPHEINEEHINQLQNMFRNSIRYSQLSDINSSVQIIIIDNIGMLSRLYQYATIAYIGGGFSKDGIHNILEAGVYGKPVFFGPHHKKTREAGELIDAGGAFSVSSAAEFKKKMNRLIEDPDLLIKTGKIIKDYVLNNRGATSRVVEFIQENRLLTN